MEAPHFTTDIFSAKSRVCICKHFANRLPSPAVRRCNSFCFYGIAAAMGLRHTNGNIGVTISKARPERFSSSTLTTISKTLFGQFSVNCFAGRKKNGLHCKPFIKKQRTSYLFLLRLVLRYATLMVFTPRRKGRDPHSHHKRKFAHEEADTDRLREAVFGKGLQADHTGGNQRRGRCVLQSVPEYFPRQRRRTDRAGGVHVRKSVFHGAQHESCCRCVSTRSRRQSR